MARLYHSPSGAETIMRCMRKAAYVYLDGIREPSTPAQLLGTEVHSIAEHYMGRTEVSQEWWGSLAGQILIHALPELPDPGACRVLATERALGDRPIPYSTRPDRADAPTLAFDFDGLLWTGFVDLTVRAPGWNNGRLTITDYKTCADIRRYAKSAEALGKDLQAATYAWDAFEVSRLVNPAKEAHLLWLYMQSRGARRTEPRHFRMSYGQAGDILHAASEVCREFDLIERSSDAPQNPHACGDYGGCKLHVSAGGPCVVHVSVGTLVQARRKPLASERTEETMAISKANRERFLQRKAKKAPSRAKADEIEEGEEEEVEEEEVEEEEKPSPSRARRSAKSPADKARALVDELEKLDERRAEIKEALRTVFED